MINLLKRCLSYFFIPAGLALLFLPFNTHRLEQIEKDFVFLKITETFISKTLKEVAPPNFVSGDSGENATQQVLKYLEESQKALSEESSNDTDIINPYGYPVINLQKLTAYPALQKQIEWMVRTPASELMPPRRLDDVSIEEWMVFKSAFAVNTNAFQYGKRIFKGHVDSDFTSQKVEIENLRLSTKVAGGIFLFLGLFTLHGMYRRASSESIQIGKQSAIVIWDIVCIGIGIIFTWWFLDAMLVKYLQTDAVWRDEQRVLFMGTVWVVVGIPVMALFTTATAIQTLKITRENITVKGLLGESTLAWSNVENIQLTEYFSPRKISGFFSPRKVATILKISGGPVTLNIMEPPFSSTKREILYTLTEYAPDELKQTILDLSVKWLSVW